MNYTITRRSAGAENTLYDSETTRRHLCRRTTISAKYLGAFDGVDPSVWRDSLVFLLRRRVATQSVEAPHLSRAGFPHFQSAPGTNTRQLRL